MSTEQIYKQWITDIQSALGTGELGDNLASVARDAAKAEVELAAYLMGRKNLFMLTLDYDNEQGGYSNSYLFSDHSNALEKMKEILNDKEDNQDVTLSIRTIRINANDE